jgi:glycosyltransferase involved in cell wall biosynthesis
VDGYTPTNRAIAARFPIHDYRVFAPRAFDLALYHLGNSPAHGYIYATLQKFPGVVVLHDLVLHHLVARMTLERGDAAGYIRAMKEAYGETGAQLAEQEALGLASLNRFDFPLFEPVIRHARGVIAHSFYVADQVHHAHPHIPVAKINHGIPRADSVSRAQARIKLGIPDDTLIFGSFGNFSPSKRTLIALDAFRTVRQALPSAQFWLVGEVDPMYNLPAAIEMLGLEKSVRIMGRVDFEMFNVYIAATDVCVNLRHPTAGETSGGVLRMMAREKPVIVSRVGWFAEIPPEACSQVEVDEFESDRLRAAMLELACDPRRRAMMGQAAREYVETECSMEGAARGYAEFLQAIVEGRDVEFPARSVSRQRQPKRFDMTESVKPPAPRENLVSPNEMLDPLALAVAELGFESDDAIVAEVARALDELDLVPKEPRA